MYDKSQPFMDRFVYTVRPMDPSWDILTQMFQVSNPANELKMQHVSLSYLSFCTGFHTSEVLWDFWTINGVYADILDIWYIHRYEPGSKLLVLGMVIQPLIGNPYNGYINPYYCVDDHPLSYGNIGSLDPSTYIYIYIHTHLCKKKVSFITCVVLNLVDPILHL